MKRENNGFPQYEYAALTIKGMNGVKRVVVFCILIVLLPMILIIIPLLLKHRVFADVEYAVSEADIVEIHQGLSTVFCQRHSLRMNKTFNAFQINPKSKVSKEKKHVRLKKSMTLPDDTLEYWGFYLLKGALIESKVCSRFEGSNLLVVKGDKTLNTCGVLDDVSNKIDPVLANGHEKVSVIFESDSKLWNYEKNNILNRSMEKSEIKRFRRHTKKINMVHKPHNPNHVLDQRVNHGGNAINYTEKENQEDGASSFENDLLGCYDGRILLKQEFLPNELCNSVNVLETPQLKMVTTHEVAADGYYYYIFYSDNDIRSNEIHVIFDVHKPVFQFNNVTKSKSCLNETSCSFLISFLSEETVIVEVLTENAVEKEELQIFTLISTCHPRMTIYIIFPTAIILIILMCAFL